MKISASVYSNKEKSLEQLVRELDAHGIDMFHIDCFDTTVFDDIKKIRDISQTPVDMHIIHPRPESFFEQVIENKVEYVSIQYAEGLVIPALPRHTGTQWGLAVVAGDDIAVIDRYAPVFDFILFMASAPGVSGKPFNKANFQRIIDFKQRYPEKKIQVDGGVNDRIAFILRLLGVNSVVSGNYLLNREFLGVGMLNLQKAPAPALAADDFCVADFMIPAAYLPVINKGELDLKSTLETIDRYGLGFALITDDNGALYGVISNADIRRGFIKYIESAHSVNTVDMVNTTPVKIDANNSLTGMLHLLNNLNFIILFLPVVDTDNRLKGAVLLNHLTRV
jgi:ribulose-phosphate 3-epimerase